MKASELRIGNRLNFYVSNLDETYTGGVVTAITEDKLHLNGLYVPLDAIKFIPITEETLIKVGFKKVKPRSGIAEAYLLKGIRIHMSNSGNWYYKKRSLYGLHDLQNLYFALKEEELKIKT